MPVAGEFPELYVVSPARPRGIRQTAGTPEPFTYAMDGVHHGTVCEVPNQDSRSRCQHKEWYQSIGSTAHKSLERPARNRPNDFTNSENEK